MAIVPKAHHRSPFGIAGDGNRLAVGDAAGRPDLSAAGGAAGQGAGVQVPVPIGQPVRLAFAQVTQDAFLSEEQTLEVSVVKHSDSEASVFSPICPHLGCPYAWQPQLKQFLCPCHGSFFTASGALAAGPAPRPLDALSYKIENGELFVQWERFQPGIAPRSPSRPRTPCPRTFAAGSTSVGRCRSCCAGVRIEGRRRIALAYVFGSSLLFLLAILPGCDRRVAVLLTRKTD